MTGHRRKMTLFQIVRGKPISKPIYGLRKTEKTEAPTILRTDNLAISNNPNGNSFAKSKTVFSLWQIALDLMASVLITDQTE